MPWFDISIALLVAIIFGIGLIFSLLPVLPGNLIVWLGVLVHQIALGEASVGWGFVVFSGIVTLVGQLADIALGIWGARRFGASWRGTLGALVGAVVGLFLPPPLLWLLLGPVVGAVLGEFWAGRTWREGSRAGLGSVLGGLLAFALKFGLSIGIVGGFVLLLLTRG